MKNLIFPVLIAVAVLPPTANAQDEVGRFYLGGGIGQAKIKDGYCDDRRVGGITYTLTSCDETDTAVKLYGGYNLHENLSVEGGFIHFGEGVVDGNVNGTSQGVTFRNARLTVKQEVRSFFGAAVAKLNVQDIARIFGKAGFHRWEVESRGSLENVPVVIDDDDIDLFYGIGGDIAPFSDDRIRLRAEYEIFKFTRRDIALLTLGLTYTF